LPLTQLSAKEAWWPTMFGEHRPVPPSPRLTIQCLSSYS
jgi:hypothetical protein